MTDPPKRPVFGWPALVREARKYIGTNPTDRTRLWCATSMNLVLAKVGYAGTNSDAAKSFAAYGHRISEPQVGAIAVLSRGKNGGHVGVVSGIDLHGNPIIISGNHGRRVGEAVYRRGRVIAYVMPSERRPASDIQVAGRATPAVTNTLSAVSHAPSAPGIDFADYRIAGGDRGRAKPFGSERASGVAAGTAGAASHRRTSAGTAAADCAAAGAAHCAASRATGAPRTAARSAARSGFGRIVRDQSARAGAATPAAGSAA